MEVARKTETEESLLCKFSLSFLSSDCANVKPFTLICTQSYFVGCSNRFESHHIPYSSIFRVFDLLKDRKICNKTGVRQIIK